MKCGRTALVSGGVLALFLIAVTTGARLWEEQRAPAAVPSPTQVMVALPTEPATATPTASMTATVTPTVMRRERVVTRATPTMGATATPTNPPKPSATATPTSIPAPIAFATLAYPPADGAPTPVPPFPRPDGVTNVLLLGNDVGGREGGRTDSMIIVSINEQARTATMLSLPRDLWVAIPGWMMGRINLALPHGHGSDYPGGGGALVKDTILYNFGIPIDFYVRLGFDGFRQIVDALGGVEVVVSCDVRDWRLISPDLDPQLEDSWEWIELGPGVYHMDGEMALWYARSRRTSSDFERGRRQQQLLRALLGKGVDLNLVGKVPALWQAYRETVETDLTLPVIARLAAIAPAVRDNGVQHLYLSPDARRPWTSPGGGAVQRLRWEGAAPILAQLMQPPIIDRTARAPIRVELYSPNETMFRLAADNVATFGFVPVYRGQSRGATGHTEIVYFSSTRKGSFDWLLAWIFDAQPGDIRLVEPAQPITPYYRVALGDGYDPCRPQLEAPTLGRP